MAKKVENISVPKQSIADFTIVELQAEGFKLITTINELQNTLNAVVGEIQARGTKLIESKQVIQESNDKPNTK